MAYSVSNPTTTTSAPRNARPQPRQCDGGDAQLPRTGPCSTWLLSCRRCEDGVWRLNTITGSGIEPRVGVGGVADAEAGDSADMGVSRRERYVSTYAELSGQILAKGLLERRYAYYWVKIIGTTAVFVGVWVVFAFLGNSWFQLVVAAVLAVVLAQFGFLGHDAAHRQIFASHRWNEWTARVVSGLFTGLSYGWWLSKHNRHHANPNKEGADPDLAPGAFAFTPSAAQSRRGLARRLARWQGYYFFPLLLLEGLALHVSSIQTIMRREPLKHRWCEAAFIVTRLGGYITVLVVVPATGQGGRLPRCADGTVRPAPGRCVRPEPHRHAHRRAQREDRLSAASGADVAATSAAAGRRTSPSAGSTTRSSTTCSPACPDPTCAGRSPSSATTAPATGSATPRPACRAHTGIVVRYLNQVGSGARDPFRCPLAAQYRV